MTTQDLILPELRPRTRHPPVPRRYEETRPVIVQEFSHKRIIDLGADFHKHLTKEFEKEKEQVRKSTEEVVWSEAKFAQDEAVKIALNKQQQNHDKNIKKLNKIHERNVKEELIKLSTQMDRLRQDDITQVKRDAEIRQQEAVQQTEQLCHQKLLQAVEATKREEYEKAEQRAALVAKQHEVEKQKLQNHMIKEKEAALTNQHARLDKEKTVAIATAREEEQAEGEKKLSHIKDLFEKQVRILHYKIVSVQENVTRLTADNQSLTQQRLKVQRELVETRTEFQRYIQAVPPFNNTESGYVIPPIHSFKDSD